MRIIVILIALLLKVTCVENRMIALNRPTLPTPEYEDTPAEENYVEIDKKDDESIVAIRNPDYKDVEEYELTTSKNKQTDMKPCAIIVLSNIQNPGMQSLLRKYRYDAKGMLIPSSVKYFVKLPQGLRSPPLLVPLNDKAFSPLGGFVRYYKEVPPIPRSW